MQNSPRYWFLDIRWLGFFWSFKWVLYSFKTCNLILNILFAVQLSEVWKSDGVKSGQCGKCIKAFHSNFPLSSACHLHRMHVWTSFRSLFLNIQLHMSNTLNCIYCVSICAVTAFLLCIMISAFLSELLCTCTLVVCMQSLALLNIIVHITYFY
jgi:hypothetical protein